MNQNLKQPKGIYVLFLTEMWERFSFYGLRALLVLYMTKVFLFSDHKAYDLYGAYMALVYASPVIGGFLADKFLGLRRAVILGGVLIALGHFCLAVPGNELFYIGLGFVICGTGFFKSCVSSLVGQLYHYNDPRRDSGFTIFYMGINLGAFLAAIACGVVAEVFGWHYGFGLAGIGMVLGLIIFLMGKKYVDDIGLPPNIDLLKKKILPLISVNTLIVMLSFVAVPGFAWLLTKSQAVGMSLGILSVVAIVAMLLIAFSSKKVERNRIICLLILMVLSVFFFALFEQAGTSLTLFSDRNIDRHLFHWLLPTAVFQSLNPFFIIVLAPIIAIIWIRLSQIKREPSTPIKFAYGLFFAAAGFGLLAFAALHSEKSSMWFLVFAYLAHTIGELCLSPVGLSAVTKLAPQRWLGMMMGIWFLSISFSNYLGAMIAKLASTAEVGQASANVYGHVFLNLFYVGFTVSVLTVILTPWLKKLMGGIH